MASQLASKKAPGTESNMEVDYVLVYRFATTGRDAAYQKFEMLIQMLTRVGLSTEVRNGDKHSLLIFARASSDEHLYGEVYRSRMKDWLYGVRTAAPDKEIHLTLDGEPMCDAERLRIVYQLITNPVEEGGAGITPKEGEWENVESIFSLHDHEYNRGWMKRWATTYTLKIEDLDEIRDRFGEKVGSSRHNTECRS
jgi:anoctamin-10